MSDILECNFSDPEHRKAVVALMNDYMGDQMGGYLPPHDEDKAGQMLLGLAEHPSKLILLAREGDEYIGLANCFINFGTFAAKPFINIHDLVVLSGFRGKGTGRQLLKAIVEKAEKLGCGKITLEVRSDNPRAQALYNSMGFGESEPVMHFWSKYL